MFGRLLTGVAILMVAASGLSAIAGMNLVPETSVGEDTRVVTPQDLAPAECDGMSLGTVIVGSGVVNGTSDNDLLIGSAGDDALDGKSGRDCVLGGGGNDTLDGGSESDVLMGGAGDDALDGGAFSNDVCYGGGQAGDTFSRCETTIP